MHLLAQQCLVWCLGKLAICTGLKFLTLNNPKCDLVSYQTVFQMKMEIFIIYVKYAVQ